MKLKFIILFLPIFVLFIPITVNATSATNWKKNINYIITRGEFYNWTSSTAYEQVASTFTYSQDTQVNDVFSNQNSLITYNNGISFIYFLNQYLDPNYLYNVTTYVCSEGFSLNTGSTGMTYPVARTSGGYPAVLTENMQYSYTTSSALSNEVTSLDNYATCRQYTSLIQPSKRSSWFSLKFTSPKSLTGFYYVLGFNIDNLGIAKNVVSSDMQNIIDNSGLASAESITEVQNSINEVKTELNNVNGSINEQTQQQQQNHQETIDTITSTQTDNPSSNFDEFESYLPENGVITNLITLPITLFQKVLSSINGKCMSYNLGNLLGTDLVLPCIDISQYLGSTIWNVIDVLFSGLFVYVIAKKMIKVFNSFSSLEEGDILG